VLMINPNIPIYEERLISVLVVFYSLWLVQTNISGIEGGPWLPYQPIKSRGPGTQTNHSI
jgi:hypothetical protein